MELLFDNGGGILLMTKDYCHFYDEPTWAAQDVATLLAGGSTDLFDDNQPEYRCERHPEDDVMTEAMAQEICRGGEWPERGAAWNTFCAALAANLEVLR